MNCISGNKIPGQKTKTRRTRRIHPFGRYKCQIKCLHMRKARSNSGPHNDKFLSGPSLEHESKYSYYSISSTHQRSITGTEDGEAGVVHSGLHWTPTIGSPLYGLKSEVYQLGVFLKTGVKAVQSSPRKRTRGEQPQ
jgi:hypothetical protein